MCLSQFHVQHDDIVLMSAEVLCTKCHSVQLLWERKVHCTINISSLCSKIFVADSFFDCLGHSLLEYLGETIPKLKTRSQGAVSQQQAAASSGSTTGGKKNKGKKK